MNDETKKIAALGKVTIAANTILDKTNIDSEIKLKKGLENLKLWNTVKNEGFLDIDVVENLWKELVHKRKIEAMETSISKDIFDDKTAQLYQTALALSKKYHTKAVGFREHTDKQIYVYQEDTGKYVLGVNILKAATQELLGPAAVISVKSEIIGKIKEFNTYYHSQFIPPIHLINLGNGVFNLKTNKLESHSPEHMFLSSIWVDYIEHAKCPKFKEFLDQILEPEYIPIIQEWFGFCLYRKYAFKKGLILTGQGDSGKTTLLNILSTFIGGKDSHADDYAASGVTLQEMHKDKFGSTALYGKYLNFVDDLSSRDISDVGMFKMLTGGGVVSAEVKFGGKFQFVNFAKLCFACNEIPSVKDNSDMAYFSRWIVVPFNKFRATQENKNTGLASSIIETELPGILNFALEGLQRLLANNGFSYKKNDQEIRQIMLFYGTSIAKFATTCLEEDDDFDGSFISKNEMYSTYYKYCKSIGRESVSQLVFSKEIKGIANYVIDSVFHPPGGKQIQGWRHARIKKEWEIEDEPIKNIPENEENITQQNDEVSQLAWKNSQPSQLEWSEIETLFPLE